jgi:hypothetical protein
LPRRANETATGSDRRRTPRYSVSGALVRLEWWKGPDLQSTPARLMNVGRSGAFLIAESFPQGRPPSVITVSLEGGQHIAEAEAKVLEVTAVSGRPRLRVAFLKPCPDEFLKASVEHRS